MLNTPFSPWPNYTEEEARIIYNILLSNQVNYWTSQECQAFEAEFATFVGTRYAVSLMNGTIALEAALHAIGLQVGDEVIVTPRTFVASASSIVFAGGKPVFVDVDKNSQNITVDTIKPAITERTKAIICVHLAGWPCDMDPIMSLAEEHNLYVIEDCAQAHGARYKGRSVGNLGHLAAWSFCQDKIMSTGGEGGMVTTNDPQLWAAIWSYKDHGKDWHAVYQTEQKTEFRWLHHSFGTNGRMLALQAGIGRYQLQKMPEWHKNRLANAEKIWKTAARLPALIVPDIPAYIEHAAYKCYVFLRAEYLKENWSRKRIVEEINRLDVPCYYGSCSEVYLEKAFSGTPYCPEERLTVAQELGERSLMFLVHPNLTSHEIDKTCQVLQRVVEEATEDCFMPQCLED